MNKQHLHDELQELNNIHDDVHPSKPDPKWKKSLVILVGLFLVFLMFSFIFVSSPITQIIEGQLESDPIQGDTIDIGRFKIILEGDTQSRLQEIYFAEQKVEFSVCLQGRKEDTTYHITNLYQPTMYKQTFNHVQFESCQDSLILLHSHPYKSCLASDTDINTLKNMKQENSDMLMIVMCEPNRFSVYG